MRVRAAGKSLVVSVAKALNGIFFLAGTSRSFCRGAFCSRSSPLQLGCKSAEPGPNPRNRAVPPRPRRRPARRLLLSAGDKHSSASSGGSGGGVCALPHFTRWLVLPSGSIIQAVELLSPVGRGLQSFGVSTVTQSAADDWTSKNGNHRRVVLLDAEPDAASE